MATIKTAKKTLNTQSAPEPPAALTVRLDRDTYRRLVAFAVMGAKRRTHQEIMTTALTEYLQKHKA